jgi:hypothetical protein
MTNEAQTMTQTDVTLADLYRYLAEERKALAESAKVWAKEMAEERNAREESAKVWERQMAEERNAREESVKEWERQMAEERKIREEERKANEESAKVRAKEREKAWAKQEALNKELNKKFSDLGITMGDVTEYTFNPDIVMQQFNELGYKLKGSARNYKIKDTNRQIIAEIDIFLQNGDSVIFIEIKTKLQEKHIDEHIERIKNVQQSNIFKGKKIIGAVAGAVIPDNVKAYALKQGLYVIEQTGDTIRIETQDNKFKPKQW